MESLFYKLTLALVCTNFEILLLMRDVPALKGITESSDVLAALALEHNLPERNTFDELLEVYDRSRLTPRCLKYHSPDQCACYFARKGDLDGVRSAEAMGLKDYDTAVCCAADSGQLHIVQYLNEEGKWPLTNAFSRAVMHGHLPVVQYLLQHVKRSSVVSSIASAAQHGHVDVLECLLQCISVEKYVLDDALISAAYGGSMEAIAFLEGMGADAWDHSLRAAVREGHLDVVKHMVEKGATNPKEVIHIAKYRLHDDIAEYLESL